MELGGKVPLHSSHIGMQRSLKPTMQSTGSPAIKDMETALHPVHTAEAAPSQQVPTTQLVHGNLSYGDGLRERVEIMDVPEWVRFVMESMTAAVTIGYPLHHIG